MDSLGRHEQLLRLCHLVEILAAARRPLAVGDLKDHLRDRGVIDELSDRTIRRDLGFLETFGYPLRCARAGQGEERQRSGWSLERTPGPSGLAAPPISLPELLALTVARDFLTPLAGTFYWRGIAQLLARAERLATPALIAYADNQREGLVVHPRPPEGRYRPRLLAAINRSIRNGLELEIRYRGQGDRRAVSRVIQPEALVLYDGVLYVAAHPGGAKPPPSPGLRFFKLDRLTAARVTTKRFAPRRTSVADALADSITIYRSAKSAPRAYRIVVAPERARWAGEKPFHPRQKATRRADGSVLLEIEKAWDDEMVPQLLALADCVEVLEPLDIRERIAATAERIVALYRSRPTAKSKRNPGR
ncbi:MAG: helix-turn-helix transcriptional regulator [Pirellulales bacterium]